MIVNQILKNTKYIIKVITIICSVSNHTALADDKHFKVGISSGFTDKGIYLGLFKPLKRNEIEIGLHYLDPSVINLKTIDRENIDISNIGGKLSIRLFPNKKKNKSGFYAQTSAEINKIAIKTYKDLSKEEFLISGITAKCSACGQLTVKTEPNKLIFVPSLAIGYQKKINNRLFANLEIGAQYVKIPKVVWSTNTPTPPSFIRDEINDKINDINKIRNELANIIPTAKFTISYKI